MYAIQVLSGTPDVLSGAPLLKDGPNMAIALEESVGLHSDETVLARGGRMQRRLFTYDEANSLIPWLQSIFDHLNPLVGQLESLREQLADVQREQQRRNGTFQRHNEIQRIQNELDDIGRDIRGLVDEISGAGIIIRDIAQGLVDFPHIREGREVYLCWIGGEESIGFWHETDRGFIHREPL